MFQRKVAASSAANGSTSQSPQGLGAGGGSYISNGNNCSTSGDVLFATSATTPASSSSSIAPSSPVAGSAVPATKRRKLKRRSSKWSASLNLNWILPVGLVGVGILLLLLWAARAVRRPSRTTRPAGEGAAAYATDGAGKFQRFSHDAPPCTRLTTADEITVTLVTQLSHDRLWMMEHHCRRYRHPMAVAVYSNDTRDDVVQALRDMGCAVDGDGGTDDAAADPPDETEGAGYGGGGRREGERPQEGTDDGGAAAVPGPHGRRRSLADGPWLRVAVLDAQTHGAWNDYPVNELRRVALSLVQTNYIIYIDVDFWTSKHLYEAIVQSPQIQEALLNDPKQALVIPSFALFRQCGEWVDCREKNIPRMPYTLSDLKDMLQRRFGNRFDPTNRGGHGSTDYKKWLTQTPGSLVDIKCLQSHRYEPYIMIRYCRDMPPFQSAFSGYGKNKVTWMMQAIASGYKLGQVGGAYLVHYPHLDSNSRQHWNEAPQKLQQPVTAEGQFNVRRPNKSDGDLHFEEFKRGQVDKLFVEFRQWMADTIPADRARLDMCHDAQDDDGKLWVNPELKDANKRNKQVARREAAAGKSVGEE